MNSEKFKGTGLCVCFPDDIHNSVVAIDEATGQAIDFARQTIEGGDDAEEALLRLQAFKAGCRSRLDKFETVLAGGDGLNVYFRDDVWNAISVGEPNEMERKGGGPDYVRGSEVARKALAVAYGVTLDEGRDASPPLVERRGDYLDGEFKIMNEE